MIFLVPLHFDGNLLREVRCGIFVLWLCASTPVSGFKNSGFRGFLILCFQISIFQKEDSFFEMTLLFSLPTVFFFSSSSGRPPGSRLLLFEGCLQHTQVNIGSGLTLLWDIWGFKMAAAPLR